MTTSLITSITSSLNSVLVAIRLCTIPVAVRKIANTNTNYTFFRIGVLILQEFINDHLVVVAVVVIVSGVMV